MPSKLDEHVKLRLHYAVSTGFLLKDWPSTGRTDWPYQGPPVQIGVQKGLMMTSDEEQIGFVFFWEGLHLHDLLLDFVRKLPKFIQIIG
jgi:hypothetical protein